MDIEGQWMDVPRLLLVEDGGDPNITHVSAFLNVKSHSSDLLKNIGIYTIVICLRYFQQRSEKLVISAVIYKNKFLELPEVMVITATL